MALSQVSPVVNRGVISNWLEDLPAAVEMLTIDTDGNVSHQVIPVASFGALTGAPGDNAALASALDGKAPVSHTHEIANVTGLQTALDGKAATTHTHVIADTTGLQAALDAKLNLSGGTLTGDLAAVNVSASNNITAGNQIQGPISGVSFGDGYSTNRVRIINSASSISNGVSQLRLENTLHIVWSGAVGGSGNVDLSMCRVGTGQLDVRGNSGLRVRNFANSDWATFQAGAVTANSDLSCSTIVKTNAVNSYNQGKVFFGYYPAARGMSLDDSGYYFKHIDTGRFEWSSTSNNNSASDLQINRNAAGQLDIRGNSGLRVRNYANNANAPVVCSEIDFGSNLGFDRKIVPRSYGVTIPGGSVWDGSFVTGNNRVTLNSGVSIGFDAAGGFDLELARGGTSYDTANLDVRAANGLRVRNRTNSGWTAIQCGALTANALVIVGTYTVATLPSAASNAGALAQVTDSSVTANGSAVAGGGSNRVIVFSNGSAWDVVVA